MSNNGTCTHIKVTGVRCGSPALRGEEFCYFHQNAHRTVRRPKQSRLHPIALIEDEESIQYSLMEVINALMRNTIDLKRATLILRALHIAVKNATRVKYNIHTEDMVTEIPKYAEPEARADTEISPIDLPAVAANPSLAVSPEGPHYWEQKAEAARQIARDESLRFAAEAKSREEARKRFAEERAQEARARTESKQAATTTRVGADAFVRPASPGKASASAPLQTADATTTPAAVPPHNFNKTAEPAQPPMPAPRKPPASATPATKERKNTAHGARRG
jgi:hypothetical protein